MLQSGTLIGSQHQYGCAHALMSTPIPVVALNCYYRQDSGVLGVRIRENIKSLRERRGLSRPQLGAMLTPRTSGQQIEKLEKGQRALTVDWIERIAVALEVDPAALVAGESGEFSLTPQVANEAARTLARVALRGAEPDAATVQVLALLLTELFEMFARHPATRNDPQAARPAIDFLARQHGRQ
jgi:transcriptional regulator with XRE-family HTH domain